jgi:hypothetical protein
MNVHTWLFRGTNNLRQDNNIRRRAVTNTNIRKNHQYVSGNLESLRILLFATSILACEYESYDTLNYPRQPLL